MELLILRKFLKHNIQLFAVLRSLGIYSIRNRVNLKNIGTEPLVIKEEPFLEGPGKAAYFISSAGFFSCKRRHVAQTGGSLRGPGVVQTPGRGNLRASLVVPTSTGVSAEAPLLGEGVEETEKAAALELAPSPFDFGEQSLSLNGKPQQFTIEHVGGGAPVKIETVKLGGPEPVEFAIVEPKACIGVELALGKTCTVEVLFVPFSEGKKEATLEVEAEAGALKASSKLSGTGVEGKPVIEPGEWNFGEVKVGGGSARSHSNSRIKDPAR